MEQETSPLIGQLVIVDQEFIYSAKKMLFSPALVTHWLSKEIFTIKYKDDTTDSHPHFAMLMLDSSKSILKKLLADSLLLEKEDCKSILTILKLISLGRKEEALMRTRESDTLMKYCLITCQDWLTKQEALKNSRKVGHKQTNTK